MTRPTGRSRVDSGQGGPGSDSGAPSDEFPSLRQRRPVIYWVVIVTVVVMVLTTVTSAVSAIF